MLLAFVLIGLAVAQPRSEWMDEFDPESAYLSIISVAKEVDSTLNSTLNEEPKELEEGGDDEEDLPPPPPPPPSDLDVDRRRPPGAPGPWPPRPRPEDRCGNWSTWQQSKCWWPDQPLDQLPPACAAIPTKAHWPEWMKKFVVGKAMEKYNMLMDEYNTRGAPPKCGRCSRSFECRMRNETSSRRGFCPSKQIRPMFNVDCEDRRACEVTQEKGGCPPPLFLSGERRQHLQKLIKDGNHEDFAKELWNMRGNDKNKRQKRQAESYFNGRFGFMPFSPQFDFPYENGRQGGRSPSENSPQLPIRSSVSSNYGYDSFGPFSDFPGTPFRPGPPGPPRHIPFGPSRDFPRRLIRPGPPGPPPRDQFGPTYDFPLPPFRPRPFGPFPRGPSEPSNDIPMHPFRPGPNSLPGRRFFPHSDDFPTPPFRSGPVDHQGRGSFVSVNEFPQPSFRNGPPDEFGRGYMQPSRDFRRSPFGSGPYGGQQRGGSFRPTDNFPQPNFHRNPFVPQERGPFGPSNDFSPLPFHTFSPFKDQRGFAPNISPATKFSMFWARPMSFPGPIPQRPPVGPPPHHQFLFDIFHGTTCVSSGKKCLCCCGHFIPNVDTGDCEDLRQLLPGIEKMVEQVVQPSQPPPPSEKAMRQTKEFFRKQAKSY